MPDAPLKACDVLFLEWTQERFYSVRVVPNSLTLLQAIQETKDHYVYLLRERRADFPNLNEMTRQHWAERFLARVDEELHMRLQSYDLWLEEKGGNIHAQNRD